MNAQQPNACYVDDHCRPVVCPRCAEPTENLKVYSAPIIAFLYFYYVFGKKQIVACPGCMRMLLMMRLLVFIPLANIVYPILAYFDISAFVSTFWSGHSDFRVAELHRLAPEEYADLVHQKQIQKRFRRKDVLVLAVAIPVLVLFCLGVYLLMAWSEPKYDGFTTAEWIEKLKSPDPQTRIDAAKKLANIGSNAKSASYPLERLATRDPERDVRVAAYEALQAVNPERIRLIPPP